MQNNTILISALTAFLVYNLMQYSTSLPTPPPPTPSMDIGFYILISFGMIFFALSAIELECVEDTEN